MISLVIGTKRDLLKLAYRDPEPEFVGRGIRVAVPDDIGEL